MNAFGAQYHGGDTVINNNEMPKNPKKTKEVFWEGFRAGLAVIGIIVGILLLIFWF